MLSNINRNLKLRKFIQIHVGLYFALAICFIGISLSLKFSVQGLNYKPKYVAPPKELIHFHFGFNHVIADSIWIRSLQDISYCDNPLTAQVCKGKSWLFHVFDVITDLDPKFQIVYRIGGLVLSVIISDIDGATILFDKGVNLYPKDWRLTYRAAYHAIYEENNKEKAARLLKLAAENGAPQWVFSLAGRMWVDSGKEELALSLLEEMKKNNVEPWIIQRLEQKIAASKSVK